MPFFQILECSSTLGNCCGDYSIVVVLNSLRKILNIIQLLVPILLIIWSVVGFINLINHPDDKKGIKKVINKYLAAAIVFFVPVIMDVLLGVLPQSFQVSACWQKAKVSSELIKSSENNYENPYKQEKKTILINPSEYENGVPSSSASSSSNNSNQSSNSSNSVGSAKGQAIVQYAKKFVGKKYVWGGSWNGEEPYVGTDCSGFVYGVFKHFGINLSRSTSSQWADKSKYTLVNSNDIRPGDVIMYNGHVGILTGNGNEIVHAKGSKWGVVVDPDYRKCSSHAIRGIMRIKGVN